MKPVLEVWEGVGLGLIIEWPSGVLFSNQTGGTSTLHPELEGVFLPIRNDCEREGNRLLSPEDELLDYFEGPKHRGTGATRGLDAEDADFIGSVLLKWRLKQITVDRSRLQESHEAWVHVLIHQKEGGFDGLPCRGFAPYPRRGVLTWSNSD
ncbi:MAG TPA: DUF6210 family protein [Gemmatimonadales bacterium]|nr:DUF6210 family protein [Gemmatimonadales bacterium]